MERPFIGIPVINRVDLLSKCLYSFDIRSNVLIINNNASDRSFTADLKSLAKQHSADVLDQKRNLGVAGSWNLIARIAIMRGYHWIFIGSNDTFLHPGSLKAALLLEKRENIAVWHLHAFNFFVISKATLDKVGWFDENFYPAYKEDQDYCYRCHLAGMDRMAVIPGCSADHVGSATISSDPAFLAAHQPNISQNAAYYLEKWGGDADAEKFHHPYNDLTHDHTYWRADRRTL